MNILDKRTEIDEHILIMIKNKTWARMLSYMALISDDLKRDEMEGSN